MEPQLEYRAGDPTVFAARGADSFISPHAVIRRPHLVYVGAHTNIDEFVLITCKAHIGDYCHIAPMTTIIGGMDGFFYMHDFTTIAAGCRIVTVSDEHKGEGLVGPTIPHAQRDRLIRAHVTLKRFASLASNVVVSPFVDINEGVVIGANSFVPTGFMSEAWTIYAGSPVRKIGERRRDRMPLLARELGYD